ncbi:MAG: LysR substrate-binding domain-containing protein [Leucothrix sp.]
MIERIHLQIILALHQFKTLTAAASALNLSQSALSHQIKHLEERMGVKLWQKEGRLLRLTQAGEQLLGSAQSVLPVLQRTEQTLQAYAEGRQGNLRIGVECYPCYEWLTRVIADFLLASPDVDVDIIQKFQFSGVEGLLNHSVDLLITPDPFENAALVFEALFDYELVLLVAADHPLANEKFCTPQMIADQTLLLFPVPIERLDIYTEFLIPAHISPKAQKFTDVAALVG